MLEIIIPAAEQFDEEKGEFINTEKQTLRLEHSLVSLSKWESKWHKPFFSKDEKTFEETVDYIRCMTLTQNVNQNVYTCLTEENMLHIHAYIEDPMTATTFTETKNSMPNREQITAELIYYWMFSFSIPIECQKWHIKKLLTLIRVFNVKNQPSKKMSKKDVMSRNASLNAARRKQLNSKG